MPSQLFRSALPREVNGGLFAGTMRVLLVTDAYVFDADDAVVDDLVAAELSATGYAREDLPAPVLTPVADALNITFASVDFGAVGGAANGTLGGAILYDETGAGDSEYALVAFLDTNDLTTNGGTVVVAPGSPALQINRTVPA